MARLSKPLSGVVRVRTAAIAMISMLAGCASRSVPQARSEAPGAPSLGHQLPALFPDSDPDNVERRFGYGESRARREEAKQNAAAATQPAPAQNEVPAPPDPPYDPATSAGAQGITPAGMQTPQAKSEPTKAPKSKRAKPSKANPTN